MEGLGRKKANKGKKTIWGNAGHSANRNMPRR